MSQFVVTFAVVFGLAIAIPSSVRWLIRGGPGGLATLELSAYEAGYLAGGRQRVAEVLIAFLIGSGTLRVDNAGNLSAGDWTGPQSGLLREFLPAEVMRGMLTAQACWRLRSGPSVTMTARDARRKRLVVSAGKVVALRLVTAALMVALLVAGVSGVFGVADNNGPAWLAALFFVVTAATELVLLGNLMRPVVTRLGASKLKLLRADFPARSLAPSRPAAGVAPPGLPVAGLDGTALLEVALRGFRAVPDAAIRSALLAGMRTEHTDRWFGDLARRRRDRTAP